MPYKNIEDRREAWRRWAAKHRHPGTEQWKKHKARTRAGEIAPERQQCSIDNCLEIGERHHEDYSQPKVFTWLCKSHHEALHHKS